MALRRLAVRLIGIPAKAPECRETAADLDRRVETEPDQRDATGEEAGDEGDETLARIPRNGDVLKPATLMCDRCTQRRDVGGAAVRGAYATSDGRPPSSSRTSS